MNNLRKMLRKFVAVSVITVAVVFGATTLGHAASNPCNPCAAKNPCAANPCAMKNPCAANPCAAKNPCAANPCAGNNPCAGAGVEINPKLVVRPQGTTLYKGSMATLTSEGEKLFKDTSLSTNGNSCQTCHENLEAFADSFAMAYPHKVDMPFDSSGVNSIALDEMVQFCMVAPMEAKPFPWSSRDLAALTVYSASLQKAFIARGPNPCAAKNPCNPCAAKNPCAVNPCAAKSN